jgi:Na+/phosphate symporter
MIGIIATVLLQSSTAAVAVVVALEEAGVMTVQAGIYMVCDRIELYNNGIAHSEEC